LIANLLKGTVIYIFYKPILISGMKKIILSVLFFCLYAVCFSQVIKGRILDINTNKPVELATIYFNGTFQGTNSDQNGYFEMEIPEEYPYPLVISSIGYYSVTLRKFSADTSLLVYLTPKVYKLQEIVVKAHSRLEKRKRAKYLEIFRNQFLGETHNAEKCVITNEKDIIFKYDTSDNTLKAFCSEPLLINNYALGYRIKYYLDKFEYCEQEHSLVIIGNYIFKEDLAKAEKLVTRMNREATYFGSRMHFLRSLYKNNVDLDDYTIVDSSGYVLDYNQLVERSVDPDKPDDAYMIYTGDIYVIYKYSPDKGDWNRVSWLKVDTTVYFDKNGYFDPYPVIWWGDMAQRRIGDLLPYEYRQK
jgi:hypothetical protein